MKGPELERGLAELGDGGGPRASWHEEVLERLDEKPPPRRTRWPLVLASCGLFAAAAAAMVLYIAVRAPDQPRAKRPAAVEPGASRIDRLERQVERLDQAVGNLMQARTEAERAEAERLLRETTEELEALKRQLDKARVRWPKLHDGKITAKCDPNDPLCGVE